jgi:nucleotide-binding universal stress UspA family protein
LRHGWGRAGRRLEPPDGARRGGRRRSHRRRLGGRRVCLGSAGERALEGAPCAVAVAPRGFAGRKAAIRAIAVGYDGSRASRVALRRAIELGERSQASLLLLGAVEISLGLAGYETRQSKELQRTAMERHLRRALETIPDDLPARSRLLSGPPSGALVAAARHTDLLVLGSRGSYGVDRRLTLGTVGAAVIEGAVCPILITPTDE